MVKSMTRVALREAGQEEKTDETYNKAVTALENLVSREETKEEKVMETRSRKVGKSKPTMQQVVDPASTVLKKQRENARSAEMGFQRADYRGRGRYQGCRPGRRGRGRRPFSRPY